MLVTCALALVALSPVEAQELSPTETRPKTMTAESGTLQVQDPGTIANDGGSKETQVAPEPGAVPGNVGTQKVCPVPYWVPSRIANAERGDTLLATKSQGGPAGEILNTFGQIFVHAGIVTSDQHIRHMTMFSPLLPTKGAGLDEDKLENGLPGIITDTIDQAFGLKESPHLANLDIDSQYKYASSFQFSGAVLVKPSNSQLRANALAAAKKIENLRGYYRVYSYTRNDGLLDQNRMQKGVGSMCSGTVWHAHRFAGNNVTNLPVYPANVRRIGTNALYEWTKGKVQDQVRDMRRGLTIKNLFFHPGEFLGTGFNVAASFIANAPNRIANQVVNCFAFNDCGNKSDRWRGGVGSGNTISPENLMPSYYHNPNFVADGYGYGVLGSYEPVQQIGGTYRIAMEPCDSSGGSSKTLDADPVQLK